MNYCNNEMIVKMRSMMKSMELNVTLMAMLQFVMPVIAFYHSPSMKGTSPFATRNFQADYYRSIWMLANILIGILTWSRASFVIKKC